MKTPRETDPPPDLVSALDAVTGSTDWPAHWLTVPQFVTELDARGFWSRPDCAGFSDADRRAILLAAFQLAGRHPERPNQVGWGCLGGQYKHEHLMTRADYDLVIKWHRDLSRAHFTEAKRIRKTFGV